MEFNYGDVVRALLGNNPNPYARLDIGNGLRNIGRSIQNRWDGFQAQYFPNQYNNMMYYIPDTNDIYANRLADRVYNNY